MYDQGWDQYYKLYEKRDSSNQIACSLTEIINTPAMKKTGEKET